MSGSTVSGFLLVCFGSLCFRVLTFLGGLGVSGLGGLRHWVWGFGVLGCSVFVVCSGVCGVLFCLFRV